MIDKEHQLTLLEKSLKAFALPEEYEIRVLSDRLEIRHLPTDKGIAINPDHYASVAAGIIAFALPHPSGNIEETKEEWNEELPFHHRENDRILLERVELAMDGRNREQILGKPEEHPEARRISAYTVKVDEIDVGYILAMAEKRFVLIVPSLNPDKSVHRGLAAAVHRLAMLVEHPAVKHPA